jgi:hypothetical protein
MKNETNNAEIVGKASEFSLNTTGVGNPFALIHCVEILIKCTGILLHKKDYDGHGHEEMLYAMRQAQEYVDEYYAGDGKSSECENLRPDVLSLAIAEVATQAMRIEELEREKEELLTTCEKLTKIGWQREKRIEVFQKAQSNIIGELVRRGDDELIEMVNKWVSEPLPSVWKKINTGDDLPKDEGLYLFQVKDCEFMNIEPVNMNPEWTKLLVKTYSAWRPLPKRFVEGE